MPRDDDLSDFEAEVADVVDPSPWQPAGPATNAPRVCELLAEVQDLLCDDLVILLNAKMAALGQYLAPNGVAITFSLPNLNRMVIMIDLPAEIGPFVRLEEQDGN